MVGTLHAKDAVFPQGAKQPMLILATDTCYGYLARRPDGDLVAAVRGTDGLVEWLEDGDFVPVTYEKLTAPDFGPPQARVDQGFYSVFKSMTLRPVDGGAEAEVVTGILAQMAKTNGDVTVVGAQPGIGIGDVSNARTGRGSAPAPCGPACSPPHVRATGPS